MPRPPLIHSDFAILDVKGGRKALANYLKKHGPLWVTIEMQIDNQHGRDDGTSIEFSGTVTRVLYNP